MVKAKKKPKRTTKKLEGFTKTSGKYRLVFKSGSKRTLGKASYKTKAALIKAGRKYLKK